MYEPVSGLFGLGMKSSGSREPFAIAGDYTHTLSLWENTAITARAAQKNILEFLP